ncbi:MAG TPA: hypothetical protein GXZ47_05955, partial [Treponema sp.]|nr:hypothetical protein [Treponema sp.]
MSLKNLQWLEGELPKLVERDIISSEQQSAITEFYEKDKKGTASIAL